MSTPGPRPCCSARAELLGCNVWQCFPDAVGGVFQTEYQRAVAQNRSVQFETYYPPLQMWWSVAAYPSARGLTVYFRDEREKHQCEQRIQEEHEALSTVLNSTTDGILAVDSAGRIRLFNPGAERLFGRLGPAGGAHAGGGGPDPDRRSGIRLRARGREQPPLGPAAQPAADTGER